MPPKCVRVQGYTGDHGLQSLRYDTRFRPEIGARRRPLSIVATKVLGSDWRYFRSIKFRALRVP